MSVAIAKPFRVFDTVLCVRFFFSTFFRFSVIVFIYFFFVLFPLLLSDTTIYCHFTAWSIKRYATAENQAKYLMSLMLNSSAIQSAQLIWWWTRANKRTNKSANEWTRERFSLINLYCHGYFPKISPQHTKRMPFLLLLVWHIQINATWSRALLLCLFHTFVVAKLTFLVGQT